VINLRCRVAMPTPENKDFILASHASIIFV